MKTTALLLPILLLACVSSYSQITLNKTNVSLQEIFDEITAQSKIPLKYDNEQLKRANRVNINVVNASVKTTLDICVSQQPFQYVIGTNSVVIQFEEGQLAPNSPPRFILTGRVVDVSGVPISEANIGIKNGNSIGKTDSNGDFVLSGLDPASTLEFTHIGYDARIVKLNNQKNLLITLSLQVRSLEEIVTNGYTTTPRRYEVGSIKKITFGDIPMQVGSNLFAAIQGRIPGMAINQKSGLPGSPYKIQIRGQRSIGITANGQLPNNSPLFIVDGVPFLNSSENVAQRSNILSNNPFSTINPDDIESIEVLKDANAIAIYGSLGANGVVLITTKKGKPGTSFNANVYTAFSTITRAPNYLNTEEYLQMRKEAFRNDGEFMTPGNAFDILNWDSIRYNNWKDLLIGGTARITNAHFRFTGGSQLTQFGISGGYNKETTVFPTDLGKSFASASFNISHRSPNKKFEFNTIVTYGFDKNKLIGRDPTDYVNTPPNAPNPYKEDGKLNFGGPNEYPFANPFVFFYQPYNTTLERVTTGLRVSYSISPQLSIRTNAGYNLITCDEIYQFPISSQDPRSNPLGSAGFGNSKNRSWLIEPQLDFRDSIGKGFLKILVGSSMRSRTGNSDLLEGTNYTNDAGLNSINNAGAVSAFYDRNQYKVISAYALVNYIFDEKYILESTIRRDGSSRFGPNRKFGTFASLGAGWIFSSEKLMSDLYPALSFGKLRFTYGTSGNDQIGDYQFLDAWSNNSRPYQVPTIMPLRLANDDYKWEVQKGLDIGLDLSFFKDRVMLSATFNQGRTSDQLVALTLPVQTGFNRVIRNHPAVTQNRNLELELSTTNIRNKDWKWTTSTNFSFLRNKLIKFPNLSNTDYGNNRFVIGKPLNLAWGYRSGGLDVNTGLYRILDKDGKVIPPGTFPSMADEVVLGDFDPDYFGGLENTIEWKKWHLQFLFQFVKQMGLHPILSDDRAPGLLINQPESVLNRWVSPGDIARYQQFTQSPNSLAYFTWVLTQISDMALADASYIRLKSLALSYDLSQGWFKKSKLKKCEVYVLGQNLLTFTKFPGKDPETWENKLTLPPLKSIAVGINLIF